MQTPDRPLHGAPFPRSRLHPRLYLAELVGTAVLVSVGLSIVILLFGNATAAYPWRFSDAARRAIAGALFGTTGALIALSPVGRISGAHTNPAVTLAFWLSGKVRWRDLLGYSSAQFAGALLGACPLLLWGARGASVHFGATTPGINITVTQALAGETVATAALILAIFVTSAHRRTRQLTPWTMPPLFAWLVWWEAPYSGASANPARSFGPAAISGEWHGFWIYLAGPIIGTWKSRLTPAAGDPCASGQLRRFAVHPGAPEQPVPLLTSPVPARQFGRPPAYRGSLQDRFLSPKLSAFQASARR